MSKKYYIARDKNNTICIYDALPFKKETYWRLTANTNVCVLSDDIFPEVKWEDKEPKILTIEESLWIKVEDRLPNIGDHILVLYKDRIMNKTYYSPITFNGWDNVYERYLNYEVIAWMYIPEFKD